MKQKVITFTHPTGDAENLDIEIQKRIDRNNKIIEKYNKVLFIPKRMVFDKGIELIIKRKKRKEEKKMKESGNDDGMTNNERYDNLLTY